MSIDNIALSSPDPDAHRTVIAQAVNNLIAGKLRVTGSFSLAAGATTTVVGDNLFESIMVPLLIPMSATAATALAVTYVSNRTKGAFTLTHDNTADVDRIFAYVRLG